MYYQAQYQNGNGYEETIPILAKNSLNSDQLGGVDSSLYATKEYVDERALLLMSADSGKILELSTSEKFIVGLRENETNRESQITIPLTNLPEKAKAAFIVFNGFNHGSGAYSTSNTVTTTFQMLLNSIVIFECVSTNIVNMLDANVSKEFTGNFYVQSNIYATKNDSIIIKAITTRTYKSNDNYLFYTPKSFYIKYII